MSEILVRFAHVSDTHIQAHHRGMNYGRLDRYPADLRVFIEEGGRWLPGPPPVVTGAEAAKMLVNEIKLLPFELDFVLHTGDVGHEIEKPEDYENARSILVDLPYPIYYAAGNHDDPAALQTVLMVKTEVIDPFDYCVDCNGVRIICMDSSAPGELMGELTQSQLDWLAATVLVEDDPRPIVIGIHHPPITYGIPFHDRFGLSNGADFHQIVSQVGVRLRGVFVGHNHQELETWQDGVLYSCATSPYYQSNNWPTIAEAKWVGARPNPGFTVVTVTTERTYLRRYHYDVY